MNKSILRLAVSALAFVSIHAMAQAPFTSDLVAFYPFNGNAIDASGHTNNGTIIGNVTPATDRYGVASNCFHFDGSASCAIEITNNPLFNIGQAGYTLSCWFSLDNISHPQVEIFFNSIPETGVGIGYEPFDANYAVGDANGDWSAVSVPGQRTNYTNNEWCQFVFVKDGTTYTTYIDGILDSQNTISAASGYNQAVTGIIGGISPINPGYDQTLLGKLDDFRIYDRALSSNEVHELYSFETNNYDCAPHAATAIAQITNGFVIGATLTDEGCGFTNVPAVEIIGGGGTGAQAAVTMTNGFVTSITITATGSGYTNAPAIYIYYPLGITTEPLTQIVPAYSNAAFSVTAAGVPPLSYQWTLNGTNLAGATNSSLVISNIAQANLGVYQVTVSDPLQSVVSSGASLLMPPYLAQPFAGAVTDWGAETVLTAQAWGTGPLGYQWYDNGVAIQGATSSTLNLGAIQFTNAGNYSVVVSSAFGSVSNVPEQVVVNPAGVAMRLSPTLVISGTVGYSFTVQSTTDLSNTNLWQNLGTLTLTQPVQLWFDTNNDASQPGNATHFYRVLPNQ